MRVMMVCLLTMCNRGVLSKIFTTKNREKSGTENFGYDLRYCTGNFLLLLFFLLAIMCTLLYQEETYGLLTE